MALSDRSIFAQDLDRTPANHVPLSPVSFLLRAARVYPDRASRSSMARAAYTYAQFLERTRRLASALARAGIGKGDTVAILAPNIPEMLEAHNAVPMLGAVLCPINTRLDAGAVGFILRALGSQSGADRPRICRRSCGARWTRPGRRRW